MKSIAPLLFSLFFIVQINAQHLPQVTPEEVGMDSQKLQQTDRIINQAIADREIPGAVLAVVKDGKMAYLKAYGNKQIDPSTVAMDVNTVFDLASDRKSVV